MHTPKRVGTHTVWQGHAIRLTVDTLERADGRRRDMDVVRHPGAAAVVALGDDGQVLLVRQWRQPLGRMLVEVPAGRVDPGESRRQAAERELREEVGVTAARWTALGAVWPSPGFCDEEVSLFLAEGLTEVGTDFDEGEDLETVRLPLAVAAAEALAGELSDAKTACALLRAQAALAGRGDPL